MYKQARVLERFLNRLGDIMVANNLAGSLIHGAYARGMMEQDLRYCYVNDQVEGASILQKALAGLLDDYFKSFPDAGRPICIYHEARYLDKKVAQILNLQRSGGDVYAVVLDQDEKYDLIRSASLAEELFDLDELERFTDRCRSKPEPGRGCDPGQKG